MAARKTTQKYARNLQRVPLGIRLDTGRRLELKPRGERGDLLLISKDEEQDPKLMGNVDLSVIEIISAAEAKTVTDKQLTNSRQAIHPAMAAMRNEMGDPYQSPPVVETVFEEQGTVVGQIEDNALYDKRVGIRRAVVPGTAEHSTSVENAHEMGLNVSVEPVQQSPTPKK